MFEHTSRYYGLERSTINTADGRTIVYVKRRFLPQGDSIPLLKETTVIQEDRLDMITARTLGNPEAFFRICDANNAMNPFDLTAQTGKTLRVPIPQF